MYDPASDAGMDGMDVGDPFGIIGQLMMACMSGTEEDLLPAATLPLSSSWSQQSRQEIRESRLDAGGASRPIQETICDSDSTSVENCCWCPPWRPSWCPSWCTNYSTNASAPEPIELDTLNAIDEEPHWTSEQCTAPPPTPVEEFSHDSSLPPAYKSYLYNLPNTQDEKIKIIVMPYEAHQDGREIFKRRGAMCAIALNEENTTSQAASIDQS